MLSVHVSRQSLRPNPLTKTMYFIVTNKVSSSFSSIFLFNYVPTSHTAKKTYTFLYSHIGFPSHWNHLILALCFPTTQTQHEELLRAPQPPPQVKHDSAALAASRRPVECEVTARTKLSKGVSPALPEIPVPLTKPHTESGLPGSRKLRGSAVLI